MTRPTASRRKGMASRVVVIGEHARAGLRSSLVSSFTHLGWHVDTVDWGPWQPAWLAAAAFRVPRLGASFRRWLRGRIRALAALGPADLVVVLKGAMIDRPTIELARDQLCAPVVCWNPDSPFDEAISNRGAGIPRAVAAYDCYVTWAQDVAAQLRSLNDHVVVIPFGWDPAIHRPTPGRGIAKDRIVFVGSATPERIALLGSIAHLHPMVFGNRWPAIEGIEVRPPVYGEEMSSIVGEARWNLNLLRRQNARSHNMRTFELPGAGGNQVAPATPDHRTFLGHDSRTILYDSTNDLPDILETDPATFPSRRQDLLVGHTYVDRVMALLEMLDLPVANVHVRPHESGSGPRRSSCASS